MYLKRGRLKSYNVTGNSKRECGRKTEKILRMVYGEIKANRNIGPKYRL